MQHHHPNQNKNHSNDTNYGHTHINALYDPKYEFPIKLSSMKFYFSLRTEVIHVLNTKFVAYMHKDIVQTF